MGWVQEDGAVRITPRQCAVWREVARGKTNKQVACALGISDQTVKNHLMRLFAVLRVNSRVALAHLAVLHGLLAEAEVASLAGERVALPDEMELRDRRGHLVPDAPPPVRRAR